MIQTTKLDSPKEFVGTWEEIENTHSEELAGRRVRVKVLPNETQANPNSTEITTPTIYPSDIESLERLYTFRKPTDVLKFLAKYPFLVPLVLEAHGYIRKHFPDSPLFLQYVPDPEIDDPQLVVYIVTKLEPEEAIDRMDEFDADWYRNYPNQDQGKMFFNLDRLDDEF